MSHAELTTFLLSIGLLLLVARIFGEIAKRLDQAAVIGELMAGVLLGPTILGRIAPELQADLFPRTGNVTIALQGFTTIAITLFLLVAGLEVDLSSVLRQGRASILISVFGMFVPFGVGFGSGWFVPEWLGATPEAERLPFALFLGTALAISALPVIAKTLLDLNIYRTDFGMLIISVAVIDDLAGWMLFAVILGMIGKSGGAHFTVETTIMLVLAFAGVILTVGRWLVDRILPVLQAYTTWPGGVLGFTVVGGALCAAFTEWIGVHAIFGAFLFGVALGDSSHLREKTRHTLENFISFIFAPVFFASIGLKVDFFSHFSLPLVLFVILIACAGKIVGCYAAGRLSGLGSRESLALGVGMNARGAMEIILALLALNVGLINERTFVALVIMAIVTSVMAGTLMERLLQREKVVRFFDFLSAGAYVAQVRGTDRVAAISELASAITKGHELKAEDVAAEVWKREQVIATGMGHGIAIPHARIAGLKAPLVAVGISEAGVDFDAPDGEPAKLIIMILTPRESNQLQLQLLADIGRTFQDEAIRTSALRTRGYVELLAVLRSGA